MSKYINKTIAENVASKMVEKIQKQIEDKDNFLQEFITKQYLKTIPGNILSAYEKHPQYFKKSRNFLLQGNGLNDGFTMKKSLISTYEGWNNTVFLPEVEDAKIIVKHLREIEKLKVKKASLKKQIATTLLSLKTYKRISVEFSEAFVLLPEDASAINAVAVPIEDIRKQLNTLH